MSRRLGSSPDRQRGGTHLRTMSKSATRFEPCRDFLVVVCPTLQPDCCPTKGVFVPSKTTEPADLQALPETGATGLEPATSGVTGQVARR